MSLLDTIVLLIEITPEFIFSKPAIDLKIVVFPLPEGPNNDIISPFATSKLIPLKQGLLS